MPSKIQETRDRSYHEMKFFMPKESEVEKDWRKEFSNPKCFKLKSNSRDMHFFQLLFS